MRYSVLILMLTGCTSGKGFEPNTSLCFASNCSFEIANDLEAAAEVHQEEKGNPELEDTLELSVPII